MLDISFNTRPVGPLQKLLAAVVGLCILALGLMFSAVLLVAGVVIGLFVWAYLWWKTRELRRAMRAARATAAHRSPPPAGGDIIEGEAVRVEEIRTLDR